MFSSPDALCLAVNHQSKFSEVADCNCCKPSSLPSKKFLYDTAIEAAVSSQVP